MATAIATDSDAWIDVLQVLEEDTPARRRERAEGLVEDVYHRGTRPDTTTTWVLEPTDPPEAIIEQWSYYGLTIMGAPTKSRLRQFIVGSTNMAVRANADSVVLSARNNGHTLDTE